MYKLLMSKIKINLNIDYKMTNQKFIFYCYIWFEDKIKSVEKEWIKKTLYGNYCTFVSWIWNFGT